MKAIVFLALVSAAFAAAAYDNKCTQQADSGPCKAMIPMWWFNAKSGKCEVFYYGGCQGNKNRFGTRQECEMMCSAEKTPVPDVCRRPPSSGPCLASVPRFYYDAQIRQCRAFIYGGCQSNGNNFETLRECMDACVTPAPSEPVARVP